MKVLTDQIRLQKEVYVIGLGTIGGLFVLGTILHEVIMAMDGEVSDVFTMGSTMAVFGIWVALLFGVGAHMTSMFNYAVSMGRTRRSFFTAYTASAFVTALVLEAVLVLLHVAERLRLGLMYPNLRIDDPAANVLHWNILLAVALIGTAFGVFTASLIVRFGKVALWVIWFSWFGLCIVSPQLIEQVLAHADTAVVKLLLRAAEWLFKLGGAAVPVLALAVSAVLLGVSYLILRRQQVN